MTAIMNRRRFLELTTTAAASLAMPAAHSAIRWNATADQPPTEAGQRGLLLYVDARLGTQGDALCRAIQASAAKHPLLQAFTHGRAILDVSEPEPRQLAYNHVLLVALPDDPLLLQAWQREATIDPASRSLYAFGFGHLQGSIGYLEADRNPFLHAAAIPKAPYECEWVSLTGTDPTGVSLAVDSFLNQGLVNGLIAAPGWKRTAPTLLDRDPLAPAFAISAALPGKLGTMPRIAVTQAAEDEYRGVLEDTGTMPHSIWQAKYYEQGQWDAPGQIASYHNYATGLHRRAYGNAIWAASFASTAEASSAAPRIANAAKLKPTGPASWTGDLPPYAWGTTILGDAPTTGTLELHVDNETVLLMAKSHPLSV